MLKFIGRVSCSLFLFWQATWAVVTVTVPSSPIQARPGSDVHLPCHFSTSGSINLTFLAVDWAVGRKTVAEFAERLTAERPGAVMTVEQLQAGNATLFLPGISDTDAGVYTCSVIHTPDHGEGTVELRVEAPPRLTLGSTKLQLGKAGAVTCTASDFYPRTVSVKWLRNGVTVKDDSPLAQPSSHGLFQAVSVLELTPQIADADANFSCQIHHQAMKDPISQDFKLEVQAPPLLQVLIRPQERKFLVAKCLVSGFYPGDIAVQWLRNGVPQQKIESQFHRMPNGTFSMKSFVLPQESSTKVSYVCHVEHKALDAPLEETVLWQPKSEADEITHPTPRECITHSSQPRFPLVPPTGSSPAPGLHMTWVFGGLGLILGLFLGTAAGIMCYKHRVKSQLAVQSKRGLLQADDKMEAETLKAQTQKPDELSAL